MSIDENFPPAFAKSQIAAGSTLPTSGNVFISLRKEDQPLIVPIAKLLVELGFTILASSGTQETLAKHDIPSQLIKKLSEGRPNIKDFIKNNQVQLIINTPTKKGPQTDEGQIRSMAVLNRIPIVTTLTGAHAAAKAIKALKESGWGVKPLQEYFAK